MLARAEVQPRRSRTKKREEHEGPSRLLMACKVAESTLFRHLIKCEIQFEHIDARLAEKTQIAAGRMLRD